MGSGRYSYSIRRRRGRKFPLEKYCGTWLQTSIIHLFRRSVQRRNGANARYMADNLPQGKRHRTAPNQTSVPSYIVVTTELTSDDESVRIYGDQLRRKVTIVCGRVLHILEGCVHSKGSDISDRVGGVQLCNIPCVPLSCRI